MPGMQDTPFGLLEMGSNSLKFYLVDPRREDGPVIITEKFPWRIAHEFFARATVSGDAMQEVIDSLRAAEKAAGGLPLAGMIAVATGVFREIRTIKALADEVKAATGVRVRVISGEDEALLMAKDYRKDAAGRSVFLFDLGGATTEWAWFENGEIRSTGSLTLGAIRSTCLFGHLAANHAVYLNASADYCDQKLAAVPVHGTPAAVGTGGTIKAAAKMAGKDAIAIEEIRAMIERALREGPPPDLKPARRAVYVPGLVILWRILVRLGAHEVTYGRNSVRDGLAGRLVRLLGTVKREDLHATLLLHSSRIAK